MPELLKLLQAVLLRDWLPEPVKLRVRELLPETQEQAEALAEPDCTLLALTVAEPELQKLEEGEEQLLPEKEEEAVKLPLAVTLREGPRLPELKKLEVALLQKLTETEVEALLHLLALGEAEEEGLLLPVEQALLLREPDTESEGEAEAEALLVPEVQAELLTVLEVVPVLLPVLELEEEAETVEELLAEAESDTRAAALGREAPSSASMLRALLGRWLGAAVS